MSSASAREGLRNLEKYEAFVRARNKMLSAQMTWLWTHPDPAVVEHEIAATISALMQMQELAAAAETVPAE